MLSTRHTVFLEVAKHNSFSRAAEALYISQPAISKHIRSLEENYNTKLIERTHLGISLTPAGQLLFEKLQEAKKFQDQLEYDLSSLNDTMNVKGLLKLGASTTVALYILPKILSGFHQQFPQISINLLNRNTDTILNALLKEEINLGIIETTHRIKEVDSEQFIADEVIVVCSGNNKMITKKSYNVSEIAAMPIAMREDGSGTLAAVKAAMKKNQVSFKDLNVKVRLGGTEALKNFLVESDCIGFFPKRSVAKELKSNELKQILVPELNIERQFVFIQRKNESNKLNKSFIRFAKLTYNF
jgi:DNA-binding transcriptional LysR family regulator